MGKITMLLSMFILLVGCSEDQSVKEDVIEIEVEETTIPEVLNEEVEFETKLDVIKNSLNNREAVFSGVEGMAIVDCHSADVNFNGVLSKGMLTFEGKQIGADDYSVAETTLNIKDVYLSGVYDLSVILTPENCEEVDGNVSCNIYKVLEKDGVIDYQGRRAINSTYSFVFENDTLSSIKINSKVVYDVPNLMAESSEMLFDNYSNIVLDDALLLQDEDEMLERFVALNISENKMFYTVSSTGDFEFIFK